MGKSRGFSIYTIFTDIMKCFFTSCGSTLLIIFFYNGNEKVTKNLIQSLVLSIFMLFIGFTTLYRLLQNCKNNDLVEDSGQIREPIVLGTVGTGKSFPYGVIKETFAEQDSPEHKEMIEIIRIHEAGHAVMAHLLGVTIEECIATITQGKTRTYQLLMEANDYKNRILILYGGAAAEQIIYKKYRAGSVGNDQADFEQAERDIKSLLILEQNNEIPGYTTGGEKFAKAVNEKSIELFEQTLSLLTENKDMILRVAKELKEKPVMSGKAIEVLFEENSKKEEAEVDENKRIF